MKAGPVLTFLMVLRLGSGYTTFEVRMPDVSPKKKEAYLCTAKKLPTKNSFAVKFKPLADEETAHHMLVFACAKPKHYKEYWDCAKDSPCKDYEETIVYAWAKNAPELKMPKNVGFALGKRVWRSYLIVQVHYARPLGDDEIDTTGVAVYLTHHKPKYSAGIYLFETNQFVLPPKSIGIHVDISCMYDASPILPFAFRTHAHDHGRVISAYRIRDGKWSLIGIGSPQRAQAFYPVSKKNYHVIKRGDRLAARCTFDNQNSSEVVRPGEYSDNEMCNFYMMYYTKTHHHIPEGCHHHTSKLKFPEGSDVWTPDHITSNVPTMKKTTEPTLSSASNSTQTLTKNVQVSVNLTKNTVLTKTTQILYPKPLFQNNWSMEGKVGPVYGLAIDAVHHVVVIHRGKKSKKYDVFDEENVYIGPDKPLSEHAVLHLSPDTGRLVQATAQNRFYVPYGLSIDGTGNYWLTDIALHQVIKFSSTSFDKPALTLGERFVPGVDSKHFCQPTDVVVDKLGDIYVTDGLCNNRIMKFSPRGEPIKTWGKQGTGTGELNTPLSLSLDDHSNHLYVCDGGNGRIQLFHTDGKFVKTIQRKEFGSRLAALHFNPAYGGVLYVVSAESHGHKPKGFTMDTSTGDILNVWNIDEGFQHPQGIISSEDGTTLYVSEVRPSRVWKFNITISSDASMKKGHAQGFPWKEIDKEQKVNSSEDTEKVLNKTVVDDDVTMVPAVVVVVVLATPIVLVFVAAIIQHMRFKSRQKEVLRQKRQNKLHPKNKELCFGCCVTPRYYYDGNRGFDKLIQEYSEESAEEEDLFSRKA